MWWPPLVLFECIPYLPGLQYFIYNCQQCMMDDNAPPPITVYCGNIICVWLIHLLSCFFFLFPQLHQQNIVIQLENSFDVSLETTLPTCDLLQRSRCTHFGLGYLGSQTQPKWEIGASEGVEGVVALADAVVDVEVDVVALSVAERTSPVFLRRFKSLWRACQCPPKSPSWFSISQLSARSRKGGRLHRK